MSKLLNPDNGFFTALNKIIDTIWLGILWTLFGPGLSIILFFVIGSLLGENASEGLNLVMFIAVGIPLILIGPATTAIYYAIVKVIRRSRSYATKQFFASYKTNFKSGIAVSAVFLLFAYLMYIDIQWSQSLAAQTGSMKWITVVFLAASLFMTFILIWIFPILSRFELGFKMLFKDALFITVKHFVRTFIMAAYIIAAAYLITMYVPLAFYIFIPIVLPGATSLIFSFLIEPVLKKYMPEAEGTPEETGEDQWYRE